MNIIKWIRGWFRSPTEEPTRTKEQQVAYEDYVKRHNAAAGGYVLNNEPSHGFGFINPAVSLPSLNDMARAVRLAKINKDLDDCKKRLEAAVKAKKKSSDIRKEYEGLRTQVLKEETKG